MSILTKIKNWLTGTAGYSQLAHLHDISFNNKCSVDNVNQIIDKFENDVKNIESNFDNSKNNLAVSELLSALSSYINTLPDPIETPVKNAVVSVETRSLDEILNEYGKNTGVALLSNGKIVNINDAFFKAVCNDSLNQNTEMLKDGIELLKILPKATVAKLRSYFTARYLNTDINVTINSHTYTVVLDEFVKNGVCYRKVVVRNIV